MPVVYGGISVSAVTIRLSPGNHARKGCAGDFGAARLNSLCQGHDRLAGNAIIPIGTVNP